MLLHHAQVLQVLVGLEVELAGDQLDHDAADRPHVADVIPLAAPQDNLGRPVLPRIYDLAVVLPLLSRPAEINYPYPVVLGQYEFAVLSESVLFEKHVFRLQVGVCVTDLVHEAHRPEDLSEE